jgi:hypothetical protein
LFYEVTILEKVRSSGDDAMTQNNGTRRCTLTHQR